MTSTLFDPVSAAASTSAAGTIRPEITKPGYPFGKLLARPSTTSGYDSLWLLQGTSAGLGGQLSATQIDVPEPQGVVILEIRRLSGLTLEELAQVLKVTRRTLHHWANGKPVTAQNEQRLQRLLGLLRLIDRCESRVNRSLLLEAGEDGILPIDLLREGKFDEVLARIRPGRSIRKSSNSLLSPEAQQTRRPPAPVDLLEALQDRPVETGRAISGKSFRLPRKK